MSCEIKLLASLLDIDKCKKVLCPDKESGENWFQECQCAVSPTGEIIVLGRKHKLVVLTSKWDSTETGDVKMKYSITWHGDPCLEMVEMITSLACLPLVPQGQSISGGADWNCIAVGYSTGSVRFYTEQQRKPTDLSTKGIRLKLLESFIRDVHAPFRDMKLLVAQTFENEPVQRIKCVSFKTVTQSSQEPNELVYVVYKTVLCTLPGFGLLQSLRACRNQLARQQATGRDSIALTNLPVDFKKFGFSDQDQVSDACLVGQSSINTFDHLLAASLVGGFHSQYRPSPPQSSLIVAAGRKPFLAFHYTVEGGATVLTDVALAVASKIKSSVTASLRGWLPFDQAKPTQQDKMKEAAQEPAEQLGCRFGLCDLWRHGDTLTLSPDGKLSAVTDSLGRVILVDNKTGIAVRLWKGYREAQCGFLEVEEDVQKRHRRSKQQGTARRALFVIIYAPKKGLVEVFTTQQGPRVGSFKVTKHGRLVYTPHGLMGFNSPPTKGHNRSQFPVFFLSTEGVLEVQIPFHCALSDGSSKKAKDLHLLKKVKAFMREEDYTNARLVEELEKFAAALVTDEVRLQAMEMMMNNKHVTSETFMAVLAVFTAREHTDEMDQLGRTVIVMAEQLRKLLALYEFTQDLGNLPPNYSTVVEPAGESALSDALLMSSRDLGLVLNYIDHVRNIVGAHTKTVKVGFSEEKTTDLVQFLGCFDLDGLVAGSAALTLKAGLAEDKCRMLGEVLFKGLLYSEEWLNDWKVSVIEANIDKLTLVKCLLYYWLDKQHGDNIQLELVSLVELLNAVCSLADPSSIAVDYSEPSPWWEEVRALLSASRRVLPALLAALCCRAATIVVEQANELAVAALAEKKLSTTAGEDAQPEWENLSRDTWQWDRLIAQLEDVALLDAVLTARPPLDSTESALKKLEFELVVAEPLIAVLSKGNGRVSELVSKWLIQFGTEPKLLVQQSDVEFQTQKAALEDAGKRGLGSRDGWLTVVEEAMEVNPDAGLSFFVMDHLNMLKKRFPYSLSSSALLANMSWEYVAYWFRNITELDAFISGLEYIKNIPNLGVRYGISYLCWFTYIRQHFEVIAKMINKVGKVPTDKLCVQEVSLTNIQVPVLLKHVCEFLNTLLDTVVGKGQEFVTNQEEFWQSEATSSTQSLVNLALSQPAVNEELVLLHLQLGLALYLIAALNIRMPKVYTTLFDTQARTTLFTDVTKPSLFSSHWHSTEQTKHRKQFLCKVVSGAVQTIEVVESIPPPGVALAADYVPATKHEVEEYTRLMRQCFDLARMWDVPLDDLRRHQVCELYACGHDRLAEEVLVAVSEGTSLASQLLVVAGQRVKVYVRNSGDLAAKVSNLSPALTSWLESLNAENLKCQNSTLDDTSTILAHVLKWLPQGESDTVLAVLLAEAIPTLENNSQQ